MNAQDDWTRWAGQWQTQPAIDVERLRVQARRKLRRMRQVVVLELLVTTTCCAQLAWMLLQPGLSWRWKAWAGFSLLFVAGLQATFLHVRRGTWQSSGDGADGMLALGLRRARAGIRMAKINVWSALLELAATVAAAAPDMNPQRWHDDPQLRAIVIAQVAVNLPFLVGAFAFCAWYVRRQRRRIAQLDALVLAEQRSEADGDRG